MKLSISNIAWTEKQNEIIYALMKKYGYCGLEIAPTKIFPSTPYEKLSEARKWAWEIKNKYGFSISSMQSIWFGRSENIFSSEKERNLLLDYTKKAIDFAAAIDCKNLVFGCPKNRNLPAGSHSDSAVDFFRNIGYYASLKGTVIGLEANPPIYHTNYITTTQSALTLIKQVNSKGFRLNLDIGTVIYNEEKISDLAEYADLINHVHISEPWLQPIIKRNLHYELKNILMNGNYSDFISIEMGNIDDLTIIEEKLKYIREVFL